VVLLAAGALGLFFLMRAPGPSPTARPATVAAAGGTAARRPVFRVYPLASTSPKDAGAPVARR